MPLKSSRTRTVRCVMQQNISNVFNPSAGRAPVPPQGAARTKNEQSSTANINLSKKNKIKTNEAFVWHPKMQVNL